MDAQCGQLTAELAQKYLDMAKEEVDAVVKAAALGICEWCASALCRSRGCISASCVCLSNGDTAPLTTVGTVRQTVGRRKDHCGAGGRGGNGDEKP